MGKLLLVRYIIVKLLKVCNLYFEMMFSSFTHEIHIDIMNLSIKLVNTVYKLIILSMGRIVVKGEWKCQIVRNFITIFVK